MLNLLSVYTSKRSFIQMRASFALGVTDLAAPQVPALTEAEQKLCLSGSNLQQMLKAWKAERVGRRKMLCF